MLRSRMLELLVLSVFSESGFPFSLFFLTLFSQFIYWVDDYSDFWKEFFFATILLVLFFPCNILSQNMFQCLLLPLVTFFILMSLEQFSK